MLKALHRSSTQAANMAGGFGKHGRINRACSSLRAVCRIACRRARGHGARCSTPRTAACHCHGCASMGSVSVSTCCLQLACQPQLIFGTDFSSRIMQCKRAREASYVDLKRSSVLGGTLLRKQFA